MQELTQKHIENFETINGMFKDAYANLNNKRYEDYLRRSRLVLEMILKDLIEDTLQERPDVGYEPQSKKNTLEGDIAFLFKHDKISHKINSYMHMVRQGGNLGGHVNEEPDEDFVEMCDKALSGIMTWYAVSYLQIEGFNVEHEKQDSGKVIQVKKLQGDDSKQKKKKGNLLLSLIAEYALQILVIVAATVVLAVIVNLLHLW